MRFLEVASTNRSDQSRIFLPILQVKKNELITAEVFSLGIRDTNCRYWAKGVVRWDEFNKTRKGESPEFHGCDRYRIISTHKELPVRALQPGSYVFGADNAVAVLRAELHSRT